MTAAALSLDERLAALVEQWRHRSFAWGVVDCCQFARAALVQIHAVPADRLPDPVYTNQADALDHWARLGGFEGLAAAAGLRAVDVAHAQRGDLVLVPALPKQFKGYALAVSTGQTAVMPGAEGLRAVHRRFWVLAYTTRPVGPEHEGAPCHRQ